MPIIGILIGLLDAASEFPAVVRSIQALLAAWHSSNVDPTPEQVQAVREDSDRNMFEWRADLPAK